MSKNIENHTAAVEVTNVSRHGFWLLAGGTEHFVVFDLFPCFREASIAELLNVEQPSPHHLYWPDLEVDLALDSLDHPQRFPLDSRCGVSRTVGRTKKGARK
jgi:hypothetical protein